MQVQILPMLQRQFSGKWEQKEMTNRKDCYIDGRPNPTVDAVYFNAVLDYVVYKDGVIVGQGRDNPIDVSNFKSGAYYILFKGRVFPIIKL